MRKKKFRIKLQTLDESFQDFKSDWKSIEKGQKPSRLIASDEPVLMLDHAMFAKVFSSERLRVIQTIRTKKPSSVSALAVLLEREQANVHRDVHFLAELGILELSRIKEEGKPESVRPEFKWSGFDIEVTGNETTSAA